MLTNEMLTAACDRNLAKLADDAEMMNVYLFRLERLDEAAVPADWEAKSKKDRKKWVEAKKGTIALELAKIHQAAKRVGEYRATLQPKATKK